MPYTSADFRADLAHMPDVSAQEADMMQAVLFSHNVPDVETADDVLNYNFPKVEIDLATLKTAKGKTPACTGCAKPNHWPNLSTCLACYSRGRHPWNC